MVYSSPKAPAWRLVLALAASQHGVVSRAQLLAMGLSARAITHRIARGRLHPVFTGVYAVGRPEITREGRWIAAVLACGPGAVLSHRSAAALWGFAGDGPLPEISVSRDVRRTGIRAHHRSQSIETSTELRIPTTTPIQTLTDLASVLGRVELERAINEADKLELIRWDQIAAVVAVPLTAPGAARLRDALARHTLQLTDSELERRFLPIARRAGLPEPLTQQRLDGYRVDFYWPDLRLVVETDGLRYHRTPATQARDARRDQVHLAAGRTPLRFTHSQVAYEAAEVERTLRAVVARLRARDAP
jgi:very-short-patch-repair endonuclease